MAKQLRQYKIEMFIGKQVITTMEIWADDKEKAQLQAADQITIKVKEKNG